VERDSRELLKVRNWKRGLSSLASLEMSSKGGQGSISGPRAVEEEEEEEEEEEV
jgi:hypothetical protein